MITTTKEINLEDYVLILPSVAVGNVGQLSVDLLISNVNLEKIGHFSTTAFIPVVGLNPYSENTDDICTTIDLYAGVEKKILVIQIRSPPVNSITEFFNELQLFVLERKISKVIILSSSYAHEKHSNQFRSTELRYMASSDILNENKLLFDNLQWIQHKPNITPFDAIEAKATIPGGGFANSLFDFLTNSNISCIVLFKFCSEGDNIPDALDLVKYLNQWIQLIHIDTNEDLNVKYPPSWKYLFGNPPASEIY